MRAIGIFLWVVLATAQPGLAATPSFADFDHRAKAGTLASYESLVGRIILDARAPVVPVIFPFMWNVQAGKLEGMKRREAHLVIAKAYHTLAGDAIALCLERVKTGQTTLAHLWP